jgi:hypothetical protein
MPSNAAKGNEARAIVHMQQRTSTWISVSWVLLAWTVAAGRLRFAITHHQVFGVETSMAFLVAVLIPVMRARRIAQTVREVVVVLRRARRDRRQGSRSGR